MNQSLRVFILILIVAGISACAPGAPATSEVVETPTSTLTADRLYPLTTRTDMEEIDDILDAVAREDVASLRPLIQFTEAKCTLAEGLGGPPKCRAGEAEGMPVDVLPFLGAEGSYLRSTEIENWRGIDVSGIYAIFEVSADLVAEEYSPVGEYAIVLASDENEPGTVLRIMDGRIVRIDAVFDVSADALNALLQREASRILLAPPS
jgi:hypothetical protein